MPAYPYSRVISYLLNFAATNPGPTAQWSVKYNEPLWIWGFGGSIGTGAGNLRLKFDRHNEVIGEIAQPNVTGGLDDWFTFTVNTTGPYIMLSSPILCQRFTINAVNSPALNNVRWVMFYGNPTA